MKKIEMEIAGLTPAGGGTNYILLLQEKAGYRKMPIIIGMHEAQSIGIAINNITVPRPLTHDLMLNTLKSFDIKLTEVIISKYDNNIFYSELVCKQTSTGLTVRIDSRTSDAIALALRANTKIYTYDEILTELWNTFFEASNQEQNELSRLKNELTELENSLQKAVKEERYEDASKIRDQIIKLKEQIDKLEKK